MECTTAPPDLATATDTKTPKGVYEKLSFPVKLHCLLSKEEFSNHITWMHHGRSWIILRPQAFAEKVLPLFFPNIKFASFKRQLNAWGFKRIKDEYEENCYAHDLFVRGRPDLLKDIKRLRSRASAPKKNTNSVLRNPGSNTPKQSIPLASSSSRSSNRSAASSTSSSLELDTSMSAARSESAKAILQAKKANIIEISNTINSIVNHRVSSLRMHMVLRGMIHQNQNQFDYLNAIHQKSSELYFMVELLQLKLQQFMLNERNPK